MANRGFTAQVLCSYHYLKPSQQCVKAASKARSILGWINRHFGSLNADEFKILYKIYVRPHVEFWYRILYPNLGLHIFRQESRAAAMKPRDAASVLFG